MKASMRRWAGQLKRSIVRPAPTPSQASAPQRGAAAEHFAADWLTGKGLRVIARNARCRGGEVDLICLEQDCVVFVEVRLRSHAGFGGAAASISAAKRARIILAAQHWLAGPGAGHAHRPCRFDALLLDGLDPPRPEWIRGAFDADG